MGSSARDKADAQAQALNAAKAKAYEAGLVKPAQPDFIPRTASYTALTAGNAPTRSTRQREEDRNEAANPEQLQAPAQRSSAGTGVNSEGNVAYRRTRDRQEAQQAESQARGEQPTSTLADYYAEQHKLEQAQLAQWELESQQRQARINAANEQRGRDNLRIINVNLLLQQHDTTPTESKKIHEISAAHPERTMDQLCSSLFLMRSLAAVPKPSWKL